MVGRLLRILLIVLVVIAGAVTGIVGAVTVRSLPEQDGAIQIEGLGSSVTVLRDANGVVNIEADTPHDLFLAQGYVHAQERLWQMEVWRHTSSGRLSELFGASTLAEDKFIRTLGWRRAAERDLAALDEAPRAALDAYAEGVNAYIESHRGDLGVAFVLTGMKSGSGGVGGYELEPWSALDSVSWQKVQAWQLGGNVDTEIFRMLADEQLGDPARTDALFPAYWDSMPVITPSGAGSRARGPAASTQAPRQAALAASASAGWLNVAAIGQRILATAGLDAGGGLADDHQVGSNNFVIGPSRSESGSALLANDPHLGISMPSIWFMNGLRCRTVGADCPYDVGGVSFPGVPGVVLGHNARIAWGATNADPDVQDLFVETADPDDSESYVFAGEATPFARRQETIKVAGEADVVIDVRETRHGPILNDVDERLADAPLLALRWTATSDIDGTFDSIFKLQTAASFDDFRAAFANYGAPSQNFVYADVDGHIGYVLPGHIPMRADASDHGARPRSGSDGKHEWTGFIAPDELPVQLDPPSGEIVSANNAAVDAGYPYYVGSEWDPGYRASRIMTMLDEADGGTGVTIDEMADIQNDTRVLRADLVRAHLEGIEPATPDGKAVLDAATTWDGTAEVDSVGATAYLTFEYRLMRGLFDDELGDLARDYVGSGASWQATIGLLDDPTSAWWDDVTTTGRTETAPDVIAAALDAAGADLRGAFGDPKDWTWGRAHQADFREQTLGKSGIAPIEAYFNKGPVEVSGAAGAVDNTYYRFDRAYPDPLDPDFVPVGVSGLFGVTTLPSYKLLIDMGDLDGARIVVTTGQSGNPGDSHYGDLIDDWAAGQTIPFPFTKEAVASTVAKRLTLVP
ncbi:MAG: penicillin acylase family protein [Chloroflexota bacterium]